MCLAVPGKVTEIYQKDDVRMGVVDFDGITKEICLEYVPEIEIGDYTIVHVGFALQRLDEKSAKEKLEMFRALGILEEELGVADYTDAAAS